MAVTINGKEVNGVLGYLLALPIVVVTFATLAVTFIAAILLMLSPILLIGFLIWRLT